jgi:hypothetical protein
MVDSLPKTLVGPIMMFAPWVRLAPSRIAENRDKHHRWTPSRCAGHMRSSAKYSLANRVDLRACIRRNQFRIIVLGRVDPLTHGRGDHVGIRILS